MNGAIAVPSVKTIKAPIKSKEKIIGTSQYFFLTFKYSMNSDKTEIFDIM